MITYTTPATKYLTRANKLKLKRIKFAIFAILLGFLFGTYMGVGYKSAKAMSYNVGQAMQMVAMPDHYYKP
jgi:hypothetical protein